MGFAEPPRLYGLDVETDTTVDGLDPRVARITAVALSAADGEVVYAGDEAAVLAAIDHRLAELPPGVIVTWNGAAFDLPFLAHRAGHCGVPLGLRLECDPAIPMTRPPLPGHAGSYRAAWYRHSHLDAYRVYRGDVGRTLNVSCSLKSIARLVGLRPVEVDRNRMHDLALRELSVYVASDATLARVLAERRWSTARRGIDRPVMEDELRPPATRADAPADEIPAVAAGRSRRTGSAFPPPAA
jgi:hypothetical protein